MSRRYVEVPTDTPDAEMLAEASTIAQDAFYYRWVALAQRTVPDAPETLLRACYSAEGALSADEVTQTIQCTPDEAEEWAVKLAAHLVIPDAYRDVCLAEDAMADYRQRRSAFALRVQGLQQRLKDLDAEMAALDRLGDVPGRREAIDAELQPLRDERRELLTSLERDIPPQTEAYRQEGEEVQRQLAEAQSDFHGEERLELEDVWKQRLQDALPLVQPLVRELQLMQHIDARAKQLGLDLRELGSQRLLDAYISRLRKALAPPSQAPEDWTLPPPPRPPW